MLVPEAGWTSAGWFRTGNLGRRGGGRGGEVCPLRVCSRKVSCVSSVRCVLGEVLTCVLVTALIGRCCFRVHSGGTGDSSHSPARWSLTLPSGSHAAPSTRGRGELPQALRQSCWFKSTCCVFPLDFPVHFKKSSGHNIHCIFPGTLFQEEVLYHLYVSAFLSHQILFCRLEGI